MIVSLDLEQLEILYYLILVSFIHFIFPKLLFIDDVHCKICLIFDIDRQYDMCLSGIPYLLKVASLLSKFVSVGNYISDSFEVSITLAKYLRDESSSFQCM